MRRKKPENPTVKCFESHDGHVCYEPPAHAEQDHRCFCGVAWPTPHVFVELGIGVCGWCHERADHRFHADTGEAAA